jgi:hypothetical protein
MVIALGAYLLHLSAIANFIEKLGYPRTSLSNQLSQFNRDNGHGATFSTVELAL